MAKLRELSSNLACTRFGDCLYEKYIQVGQSREICLFFSSSFFPFFVLFCHFDVASLSTLCVSRYNYKNIKRKIRSLLQILPAIPLVTRNSNTKSLPAASQPDYSQMQHKK